MCGIAGYWKSNHDVNTSEMRETITRMTNVMFRRGPDHGGIWINPHAGLALGQRRLAIRDLSPAGNQPMVSTCGRYVLTYNGEIYNAEDLRSELVAEKGVTFSGNSDSEVVLYACAYWGVEAAIKRMIGMFAFAFWDNADKKLFLARDRMGIKPLYWGRFGKLVVFGSELKALLQHSGWEPEVNRNAVAELMRCCYISGPHSIYTGVEKLQPGHLIEFSEKSGVRNRAYWNPREEMHSGLSNRFSDSDEELISELDQLLRDTVKRRMISDVPLGAFLSGGIDSSLIAALMQAQSERPIKTFSIGFEEPEYNEAPYAKEVAKHLGTDHTEEYMSSQRAWDIIPKMPDFYDEPFADSSQLPTYLLSQITRKHVTVALSGDGGDELFGGYERYFNFMNKFPRGDCSFWKKRLAQFTAPLFAPQTWDKLANFVPSRFRPVNFGLRLHGFARRASMTSSELYRQIGLGHWPDPVGLVIGSAQTPSIFSDTRLDREIPDPIERMQFLDTVNYLPDDILVKTDRASMANSLETRVPLLDHRVYEFSWRLLPHMKVRDGKSKWILRKVLERYLPSALFDRPKMGFGVPIDHWLRGPLRDWAEDLLEPNKMKQEGFLRPELVRNIWERHLQGPDSYHYWIWDVLMFQAWLRSQQSNRKTEALSTADSDLACVVHS